MMEEYLYHHGILGQKWGVRRYQNPDGSLTAAGRARADWKYRKKNPWDAALVEDYKKQLFDKRDSTVSDYISILEKGAQDRNSIDYDKLAKSTIEEHRDKMRSWGDDPDKLSTKQIIRDYLISSGHADFDGNYNANEFTYKNVAKILKDEYEYLPTRIATEYSYYRENIDKMNKMITKMSSMTLEEIYDTVKPYTRNTSNVRDWVDNLIYD